MNAAVRLRAEDLPMDLLTQTHLCELRQSLLLQRANLRSDLGAAVPPAATVHEQHDRKDDAQALLAGALDDAERRRDLAALADVDAALHRLDAGVYGDCAECGEPIALQRLRVQPAALRCTACQAAMERAAAHSAAS